MNKVLIFAGIGGVALLLLGSSSSAAPKRADEKVSGLPELPRIKYQILKPGETTKNFRIGPAVVLLDGQPLPSDSWTQTSIERYQNLWKLYQDTWALRRHALAKEADQVNTDAYSKELYWVPSWLTFRNKVPNASDLKQAVNGAPIDEFGRTAPGKYGDGPQGLWDQTFGGLLKNPLFKTVVVGALIASGPEGIAIYGAYSMWEARGQELTIENVALTSGRAYAVSQCGPACGVAFDFGVGVASGKSVDKSAEDALLKEMTPAQRAYFKQGKTTAKKIGVI